MNQNLEQMLAEAANKIKAREEKENQQNQQNQQKQEKIDLKVEKEISMEQIQQLGDKLKENLDFDGDETIEEIRNAIILNIESTTDEEKRNNPDKDFLDENDLKLFDEIIKLVDKKLDEEENSK